MIQIHAVLGIPNRLSIIRVIYLLTSLLHADIAIPVDAEVLKILSFLKESGINLEQPGLRYLIFGWGSKEFYTTAGSYADITFSATFKAITGDTSVMHVVPSGQLVANDNSTKIDMSSPGFARLISFLRSSFAKDGSIGAIWLKGQSHGYGDVFYQAIGNFNIFNPCNIWTAEALKFAGIQAGLWTPTTFSLKLALRVHN